MHSVNTNGEAADREERQEILHHDDKDQLGEKEGKQGSEEEGVSTVLQLWLGGKRVRRKEGVLMWEEGKEGG